MDEEFKNDSQECRITLFALQYFEGPTRWFEKFTNIGPCFTSNKIKAAKFSSYDDAIRAARNFSVMCPVDVVPHPANK